MPIQLTHLNLNCVIKCGIINILSTITSTNYTRNRKP